MDERENISEQDHDDNHDEKPEETEEPSEERPSYKPDDILENEEDIDINTKEDCSDDCLEKSDE